MNKLSVALEALREIMDDIYIDDQGACSCCQKDIVREGHACDCAYPVAANAIGSIMLHDLELGEPEVTGEYLMGRIDGSSDCRAGLMRVFHSGDTGIAADADNRRGYNDGHRYGY